MRNFFAGISGGSGAFAAAGLCLVLIAGGFYVQSSRNATDLSAQLGLDPTPQNTEDSAAVAKPAAVKSDDATPASPASKTPDSETAEAPTPTTAEPDQEIAKGAAEAEPNQKANPAPPEFDEVRRETDGVTVIAGRAAPGAEVSVLQDGAVIARATANASGKFATIGLTPTDGQGHVLSLLETLDGKETVSADEIILAPGAPVVAANQEPRAQASDDPTVSKQAALADPAIKEEGAVESAAASEAAAEPNEAVASIQEDPVLFPEQTDAAEKKIIDAAQDDAPAAVELTLADPETKAGASAQDTSSETALASGPAPVAVLKSTAQGVELLNTPSPQAMTNVALDTISYSDVGEVELAGRAQSDTASVRVYLDNTSVVNLPVDDQGRWRGELPDVDEGHYTLRVDEVSTSGKITSRVEAPFKRESAEELTAAAAGREGPISAITVQKGATLWAIARARYGDGALYVRVVEANSSAIRNPDLIYPGQVFDLPD